MVALNNTELNKLFSQIEHLSGDTSKTGSSGKSAISYDDIAWFGNAINSYGSATTDEEKFQATQGIVQKVMSLVNKFACNEAKAAQKDVKEQDNKTQQLTDKSKDLGAKLDGEFSSVASDIDEQTNIVKNTIETISKTQKSVEEKQQEIEEIVKQIEAKQKELANTKNPEDQARLLGEIQEYASQISNITLTIEDDNKVLEDSSAAVEDCTQKIESNTEKINVIEEEGNTQIAGMAQDAASSAQDVAQTSVTGSENQATAIVAGKSARTASSNLLSGASLAPKLYRIENDQQQAATTRLSSIAGNINRIAQGIGNLSDNLEIISSFKTSIGSAIDNYATAYGSWESAINPLITSLGSFSTVTEGVEELNATVKSDFSTIGYSIDEDGNITKDDTQNTEAQGNEGKDETSTGEQLQTPEFDIKKLSFGI